MPILPAIALCSALPLPAPAPDAPVPDWIQIMPAGPVLQGRDGRRWRNPGPEAIIATTRPRMPLPLDIEHATELRGPAGKPAPAAGWIEELDVRDGAIWGRVVLNAMGRGYVADRQYRFVSPAFQAGGGVAGAIVSVALTNQPNFSLQALNRAGTAEEGSTMSPRITQALGLVEGADEDQVVGAIEKLKSDHRVALNRAATPDPARFVPSAEKAVLAGRVADLEAELNRIRGERIEAEISALVDGGINAGKIVPATRDHYVALCRAEGGLATVRALLEAMPVIVSGRAAAAGILPKGGESLGADELALCRQLGISGEAFVASRKQIEGRTNGGNS